jgi:hypothetical protein
MEKVLYGIFPGENFVDLSLYQFGYEECDLLHSFDPATRNHFLFHYILSGRGRFEARDDRNKLTPTTWRRGRASSSGPGSTRFILPMRSGLGSTLGSSLTVSRPVK